MTPFEYVTVLVSIILGLGITQIVTGVADMIHHWERIRLYWPHLLWITLIFFLQIQEWWQIYDLRNFEAWRLPTFLLLSFYPIGLFIMSRILFPFSLSDTATNFRLFYMDNFRKFFLMAVLLILLAILVNVAIMGYRLADQGVQLTLLVIMSTLTVVRPRQEWIHQALAVLLTGGMLSSIALRWNEWLISN